MLTFNQRSRANTVHVLVAVNESVKHALRFDEPTRRRRAIRIPAHPSNLPERFAIVRSEEIVRGVHGQKIGEDLHRSNRSDASLRRSSTCDLLEWKIGFAQIDDKGKSPFQVFEDLFECIQMSSQQCR
jgi:hypothetical protein